MNSRTTLFAGALILVIVAFCFHQPIVVNSQASFSEGFEAGGKTAYAAGTVQLGTGQWYMDDALTGNLSSDAKTGSYSARIRNVGSVQMNFNVTGAGNVTVQHAVFGTDGASAWELDSSTNNGSTWTKVGATVTTSSTSLLTASFTVNTPSGVRFRLLKTSGAERTESTLITSQSPPTRRPRRRLPHRHLLRRRASIS